MQCNKRIQTRLPLEDSEAPSPQSLSKLPPEITGVLEADPNARVLPLNRGGFTILDADMFEHLHKVKWFYQSKGYAACLEPGGRRIFLMHTIILGPCPAGHVTDHKNRNKLDNRRTNLRFATFSESQYNRMLKPNASTGIKGVYRRGNRIWAAITIHYKKYNLGTFATIEDAKEAYGVAASKLHGDFVCLETKLRINPTFIAAMDRRDRAAKEARV